VEESLRLHERIHQELRGGEDGAVVDVIDVCGQNVEVVGAIGSGKRDDKAAAAAPSPPPFIPQPQPAQCAEAPHLSVPRLIDAFLQPPSPKLLLQQQQQQQEQQQQQQLQQQQHHHHQQQQQQVPQFPRRLSSDEPQQNSPKRCNDPPGSPSPLAARRPSADDAIPLMTQRAAGSAAAAHAPFQPAYAPANVTPGGPPQIASSWSLSIMREGGDVGVDLVRRVLPSMYFCNTL
jgi:hypothetical protein